MLKRKKSKPAYAITIILIISAIVVGYFLWNNWQNNTDIISFDPTRATFESNEYVPVQRTPLEKGDPDRLLIPDRDIQTPVIFVNETTEEVFQEALTQGVVHYPGTAKPGEPGNPYIFGHSSDYFWKPGDYKEIFRELIDIPLDTEIHITNSAGELFIFRVIETKIVGPKEVSVLDQYNYKRTMLTLQTSYPLGTALKRYIVVAELDDMTTYGPTGE